MTNIHQLIADSFQLYTTSSDPAVVRPAIPILYFGDSTAYRSSRIKAITVALNPSRAEFPEHDRFWRFPAARPLGDEQAIEAPEVLIKQALDGYFCEQPYRSWFDPSFEYLLNGFGASFYGGECGTALHTDIASPLATDPTWSGLSPVQRAAFGADGVALWHALVDVLEPDLIVISTAARHLDTISFARQGALQPLLTLTYCIDGTPRRRPYLVQYQRLRLGSGKPALLIFGAAAQKPFAKASRTDQLRIGRAIGELIN